MKTPKFPFKQSAGYIYDNTGSLIARVFDDNIKAFEVKEIAEIMTGALNKQWNTQNFDKLLKSQGFDYPAQYFNLIVGTYTASNEKAEQLFSALPLNVKKTFISFLATESAYNSAFIHFLNLL